jgi:hypothetical protein
MREPLRTSSLKEEAEFGRVITVRSAVGNEGKIV